MEKQVASNPSFVRAGVRAYTVKFDHSTTRALDERKHIFAVFRVPSSLWVRMFTRLMRSMGVRSAVFGRAAACTHGFAQARARAFRVSL
eukprot:4474526-Pleurochrysis_carterae.AAC.1